MVIIPAYINKMLGHNVGRRNMGARISDFRFQRPDDLPGVELFYGATTDSAPVRHMHDDFRFGVSLQGVLNTRYRGINFTVGPGLLQLAQPGETSSCVLTPGTTHVFLGLSVSAERLDKLSNELDDKYIPDVHFPQHVVQSESASAFFAKAHSRISQPASALERTTVLRDLVGFILRRFAGRSPERHSKSAPQSIRQARDYIEDRLSENPTLDDLATITGLSPFHLSRLFQRNWGLPPHAYQNHRRIQRAKEMLVQGLPGDEVAYALGFFDQSHFIRQFKKQVGVTPHVYRRSFVG